MAQNTGYSTTNFPVATAAQIAANGLISVDTQVASGASPQTIAAPVGLLSGQTVIANAALTAFAGGGQASATLMGFGANVVNVVATAADSVKLPPAIAGKVVFVRNTTATSMQVFGGGTSTINGVATATGVAQAATTGRYYICITGDGSDVAGTWVSTT